MVKTVAEAFDILIDRLKPSETETIAAQTHRVGIETRLTQDFAMQRLFRSGSFGFGTSVKGYSDLDYFAVIPAANMWASSDYTLAKLRDSLKVRYPQTAIVVRSPTVVIPFGGGAPGERHEIAPASVAASVSGYSVYFIPDRSNGWMTSSPAAASAYVNMVNNKLDKKPKQLIRLVKYWNYLHAAGLRSIYVEMRTAEYANGETSIIYSHDVRRTLSAMYNKSLAAMNDPLGVSSKFVPCTDAVKVGALSKLQTAITRAGKAIDAERDGKIADAFYWWNLVFDGNFPRYH